MFWIFLLPILLFAGDPPVLSKGRFRPHSVHAKLWMQELYGRSTLKKEHRNDAPRGLQRADDILWDIQTNGTKDWESFPLIYTNGEYHTPREMRQTSKGQLFYTAPTTPMVPHPHRIGEWTPLQGETKEELWKNYDNIAGTPYQFGALSTLTYPTKGQLIAESLYYHLPLLEITIILYVLALLALGFPRASFLLALTAFLFHTAILALRIYILGRPPVANMFETLLYVPWITMFLAFFTKRVYLGALVAAALLLLGKLSGTSSQMENVQAVLDSQYWLTIHVLMVVASYGAFFLSGAFAHLLALSPSKSTEKGTLTAMYVGTALLIPGTILGGVWAAQSWGRFWDWDPKESWAFISSCLYLAVIHAYRYKKIGPFGLAIGSILGLQAITFTWYGVNYILGTGLHSYGFGSGGEAYYALWVLAEFGFILFALQKKFTLHRI